MITTLIGVATLFATGSLMAHGSTAVGATPVQSFGVEAALSQTGDCASKEAKPDAKEGKAGKAGKAKDGSCGKGSCGSDMKQGKKEGSCGKDKKAAAKKAAEKKEAEKK